jgi:hypothetical protein
MIEVWQKQAYDNVKSIPHLKATLTYQLPEDKQRVYCEMRFETPYKAVIHDGRAKIERYGDMVICRFVVPDGRFVTLRIDHPDRPIYGCTTRYEREESLVPFFFLPTFNMDIEVREGKVSMPERDLK